MNCQPVNFLTPKRVSLNGLWFYSPNSKTAIIFVHGLGSNLFWPELIYKLANNNTSVLAFNNKGHDKVSTVKFVGKNGKIKKWLGGSAYEKFTDCADDIQGAVNFCKRQGIKRIILVGHSTGCQKSIYFLAKNQSDIDKVILLCPISDYADALTFNKKEINKVTMLAKKMVASGKSKELIPTQIWPHLHTAQRFLSLFTPDSKEEIFCYATPSKKPTTLLKNKIPTLLVFADKDEYLDRPLEKVTNWFKNCLNDKKFEIKIVSQSNHKFVGREDDVVSIIKSWID